MPSMESSGRRVRRGPRVYDAEAGTTVPVHASDVAALEARGFELVEGESSSTADLEALTVAELRDRAAAVDLEGRSSMSKADLVSALSIPPQQEA